MTGLKTRFILLILLLLSLVLAGAYFYYSNKFYVSDAIESPLEKILAPRSEKLTDQERLSRSIELAAHLITIRYRTSTFSCLDKEYSRLPWGLWKGEARMCWTLEADVTAGFRTSDLNILSEPSGEFVIKARRPRILGVDNKSSRLIYAQAGERFNWSEHDIFPDLNEKLKAEAQNLGILEDAKKSLIFLAESLSVKYGIPVRVEYISRE
jgi:hypothetical protein